MWIRYSPPSQFVSFCETGAYHAGSRSSSSSAHEQIFQDTWLIEKLRTACSNHGLSSARRQAGERLVVQKASEIPVDEAVNRILQFTRHTARIVFWYITAVEESTAGFSTRASCCLCGMRELA